VTKQEIYEDVLRLTSELTASGVVDKIFAAASRDNGRDVDSVYESYTEDNLELHERIVSFGEEINRNVTDAEIFAAEEDQENGVTVFLENTGFARSFYVLCVFALVHEEHFFVGGRTETYNTYEKLIDKEDQETE